MLVPKLMQRRPRQGDFRGSRLPSQSDEAVDDAATGHQMPSEVGQRPALTDKVVQ